MTLKQALFNVVYRCVMVAAVFATTVICVRLLPWMLGQ